MQGELFGYQMEDSAKIIKKSQYLSIFYQVHMEALFKFGGFTQLLDIAKNGSFMELLKVLQIVRNTIFNVENRFLANFAGELMAVL